MTVNTNIIVSGNEFSGFKNYTVASCSAIFTTQSIAAGQAIGPIRASTSLNNANAISEIQIQYSGLDSFTRLSPGYIVAFYPGSASPTYEVQSFSYFKNGTLFIDSYISNQTASPITPPTITFLCRAFLFVAPF